MDQGTIKAHDHSLILGNSFHSVKLNDALIKGRAPVQRKPPDRQSPPSFRPAH